MKQNVARRFRVGTWLAGLSVWGLMVLTGCSLSIDRVAIPLDTHIAEVGVGVQTLPLAENWSLFRLSPFWWDDDRILLANLSLVTASRANDGLTLSGITVADKGLGLSVGAVADVNHDHLGVRLGAITCGGRQVGLQVGGVNWCSPDSYAVQVGLLNWNGRFWFPLVNVAYGLDTPPEPAVASLHSEASAAEVK